MVFSGVNPETKLVEIIELPNHPFFVAAQYHPEYKSTVAENPSVVCELCKSSCR